MDTNKSMVDQVDFSNLLEIIKKINNEKDQAVKEKDQAIKEKDQAVKEKDQAVKEKDQAIKEKDQAVKKKNDIMKRYEQNSGPKFSNGAIGYEERNKKYYYVEREHTNLKKLLEFGTYFLLHGAKSSSKTTTIFDLMDCYKSSNKFCFFYIKLSPTRFNNAREFWKYFYSEVKTKFNIPNEIEDDDIFSKSNSMFFDNKLIFVVIDELSTISGLGETEFSKILSEIRTLKQSDDSNVHSWVGVGPFSITKFPNSRGIYPHFNVENFEVSVFTLEEVKKLFLNYQTTKHINIDEEVIENIFSISNGHPGLVSLCGRSIDETLSYNYKIITFDIWMNHANSKLYTSLIEYKAVSNLMDVLTSSNQYFKNLVYQFVVHFPKPVTCNNFSPVDMTNLLTHGFIKRVKDESYSLSSQLLKYCILQKLGVIFKREIPNSALPVKSGSLDVPSVIESLVPLFSFKSFSTKLNRAQGVGSIRDRIVPAESFYHIELITLLCNWGGSNISVKPSVLTSTGLVPDLIVKYLSRTYVIELCAHVTSSEVKEYIERSVKYKKITEGVDESWVINFTTGKEGGNFSYNKSNKEVGVIHVYHNYEYTDFQITTLYPQN